MYHNFFICSSVNGQSHCFHVPAIVNSAAMRYMCTYTLEYMFFRMVFSGYMPSSGIAESKGSFILSFKRNLHVLLHSGFINLHSHQQVKEGSLSSTSSPAFIVHRLLMMAILTGVRWFVVVVVQSLSCVQLFATSWTAACHPPLPSIISWSFLEFMSIRSVMLSNHLILCCPFLLLPSIFPIRDFCNESALQIRWPKC